MVKDLTFEDLKNDKDFINGLKNEEFILVLGAGFSHGIKNKSTSLTQSTIPLGSDFLDLTNAKFDSETNNYGIAAGKWKYAFEDTNDERLVAEFKNLFLADEEEFDYENFERIFLPNWFKIYTLNFDNVLDLAQKNIRHNYPIFTYPKDASNTRNSISHLHGKIEDDFQFDKIVFSPSDYIKSAGKKHDLYDPFHGDIRSLNKNIVIIGTQLTEQAVLSKFFDGLEDENITIYHFEFKNNNTKELPQFNRNNYKFIKLTNGVQDLFEFFEENRHKIEHYELEGARIIDKDFIEELAAKTFLPKEFYISKLSDDCQWYGCQKGWGIKRALYNDLKDTVHSSFNEERVSNVAAVVHGAGGCGKSTQLRILALELYNEKFKTVWIENFEAFNENAVATIENNSQQNFLVIIEDWYRLYDMYGNLVVEVFNKLASLSNVRLVIGDRTLKKVYINKLFNAEKSKFEILPDENYNIIKKIANKVTDWQKTCEAISENDKIQNTSLFSVLFIIADIYNKDLPAEEIRFIDIKGHFADIVKSDVKKIAKRYPGLAKAMVFFANIYKKYKILITKDALLAVAKQFNPAANYILLDINSLDHTIDRLISNYISQTAINSKREWINNLDFIQFNHDTLAEDGLSKSVLESWSSFDNQMELFIVDTLVTSKEEYTISNYLYFLFKDDQSFFKNRQDLKLAYIEKLYTKRVRIHSYLLDILAKKSSYKFDVKKKFAIDLLNRFQKKEEIFHVIINNCFKILKGEKELQSYAIAILDRFQNNEDIRYQILSNCLTILKEKQIGKDYAISILNRFQNDEDISKEIIGSCLGILKFEKEGKDYAISILNRFNANNTISYNIISNCLTILKEETEGKDYAITILNRYQNGENISKEIVNNCLTILLIIGEGKDYAISIMNKYEKDENISFEIISNCLTIFQGTKEGKEYAINILNRYIDDENISPDIISNCLTILKEEKEGKTYAISILDRFENDNSVKHQVVSNCLTILNEDSEGKEYAISILDRFKNGESIYHQILSNCLTILKNELEGKEYAAEILNRFKGKEKMISVVIFGKCLSMLKENKIGLIYAKEILDNWNTYATFANVFHSLNNYAFFKKDHQCVAEIIKDYREGKSIKGVFYRYLKLFNIPFFYNKSWLSEAKNILYNWRKKDKELVSNVLYVSQNKPEFTIKTCKQILDRLQDELNIQSKRKEITVGYILNALRNPLLHDIYVKLKVKEFLLYNEENDILSENWVSSLDAISEEINQKSSKKRL